MHNQAVFLLKIIKDFKNAGEFFGFELINGLVVFNAIRKINQLVCVGVALGQVDAARIALCLL